MHTCNISNHGVRDLNIFGGGKPFLCKIFIPCQLFFFKPVSMYELADLKSKTGLKVILSKLNTREIATQRLVPQLEFFKRIRS